MRDVARRAHPRVRTCTKRTFEGAISIAGDDATRHDHVARRRRRRRRTRFEQCDGRRETRDPVQALSVHAGVAWGWVVRPTDSPTDYTAPVLDVSRAPCACACARARRVVYKRHNAYEVANVVMYARDDDDERRARDINNKDVYAECPNSTPPNVRTPTTTTGDDDDACPRQTTTTTIDDVNEHTHTHIRIYRIRATTCSCTYYRCLRHASHELKVNERAANHRRPIHSSARVGLVARDASRRWRWDAEKVISTTEDGGRRRAG